jgi:rRNA maturation RNase YbeY
MVKKKAIYFFSEGVSFILRNKIKIRNWILNIILSENYIEGQINFIFCSDKYLNKANLKYLQHDTFTDIITFDTSEKQIEISGDIFISIERVRDNAKSYKVLFTNELHRVMIHGILHLIGYNDKTKEEKVIMRRKEDYYLSLLPKFIH